MMKTTTDEQERIVRKAVRARSLVDPLGAMGYRTTSGRVDREARWRRAAFAVTASCFSGVLGWMLIGSGTSGLLANEVPTAQIVSEITVPTVNPAPSSTNSVVRWEDDDEAEHEGSYGRDDSVPRDVQVVPVPSQDAAVAVQPAPVQPSHGRTGGS